MLNLTPHPISLKTPAGVIVYPPSGTVARVTMKEVVVGNRVIAHSTEEEDYYTSIPVIRREPGEVQGIPPLSERGEGVIVSAMVLAALGADKELIFAPDTGPTAIRNTEGQITAVTRLVEA